MTASPLTCLKDHPRKGEKLTLSPSGSLAAITDSLGRILLLDTKALVVVRLWKVPDNLTMLFCFPVNPPYSRVLDNYILDSTSLSFKFSLHHHHVTYTTTLIYFPGIS